MNKDVGSLIIKQLNFYDTIRLQLILHQPKQTQYNIARQMIKNKILKGIDGLKYRVYGNYQDTFECLVFAFVIIDKYERFLYEQGYDPDQGEFDNLILDLKNNNQTVLCNKTILDKLRNQIQLRVSMIQINNQNEDEYDIAFNSNDLRIQYVEKEWVDTVTYLNMCLKDITSDHRPINIELNQQKLKHKFQMMNECQRLATLELCKVNLSETAYILAIQENKINETHGKRLLLDSDNCIINCYLQVSDDELIKTFVYTYWNLLHAT
jgi:hypothetical protein